MAQIHNDPEALRGFANHLEGFRAGLVAHHSELGSGLDRLGDSWRDQKFEDFAQRFESLRGILHRLHETIGGVTPRLREDADILEEAQRQAADSR